MKDWEDLETFKRSRNTSSPRKLTWEKVEKIRLEYIPYLRNSSYPALAQKYGVSKQTIQKIISNQIWKRSTK